jgi:hypothetical protein
MRHEGADTYSPRWSDALWEQFRAESAERSAHATVIVTILATALLLAWSVGDFEYFPEHATQFAYYRVAAVILVCGPRRTRGKAARAED